MPKPSLLPLPRELKVEPGFLTIGQPSLHSSPSLAFETQLLLTELERYTNNSWSTSSDASLATVQLWLEEQHPHPQGYQLVVSSTQVVIRAGDAAGIFYGVCTLRQLLQQYGNALPCLTIHDWPDYPNRGVMLDISRDKVPTLATTLALVDRLASWKINQVQLYMEHTFAYPNHPEVWADASPFTPADIQQLDAYCRERHIELLPNQNSLGHMERWLKHPRYHDLAECPDGFEPSWGGHSPPTTLNPLDPRSLELIVGMYDQLLPNFSSKVINVGGDEPWELGKGHSREAVEQRGGEVYLEYLLKLYDKVTERGRKMQFWADIILHYPALVPRIPRDVTPMLWWYEGGEAAAQQWQAWCQIMKDVGIPFYVCPGTSSWNSLIGRTDNALDNIGTAARTGLQYGAIGLLNTDWGDNHHWQPIAISELGLAYGAAVSWCVEANESIDLPDALNRFVFQDDANLIGQLVYDLGNLYKVVGPEHVNGQILAYTLQFAEAEMDKRLQLYIAWGSGEPDFSPSTLRKVIDALDKAIAQLERTQLQRPDADQVVREIRHTASLVRHSTRRWLLLKGEPSHTRAQLLSELESLIEEQQRIWLARNRPGGLEDSLEAFSPLLSDYRRI